MPRLSSENSARQRHLFLGCYFRCGRIDYFSNFYFLTLQIMAEYEDCWIFQECILPTLSPAFGTRVSDREVDLLIWGDLGSAGKVVAV